MHGSEYFPADLMNEINKIMGYDLNDYIKYMAVKDQIYVYASLLDEEDAQNININRYYSDYSNSSALLIDEYEKTSITKIDFKTFSVKSGFVHGRIDNRFSLDEDNDYLRVVATSGRNRRSSISQTEASVYIFDSKMDVIGKLTGLAPREDVKSSRYAGDKLYLVTYERIERIDPFFVIDLSHPEKPTVLGELKIPGFSTYLHPLSETLIIGVGYIEENGLSSKIALYDVSDVNKPIELDTSTFGTEEYVSLSDPHSFLWDPDKNLMVIPSYEHAYIFEVKNSKISLIKDDYHKGSSVQRSIYINDYLYIISSSEVHIYDQNTWQLVNVISIPQPIDLDYRVYPPPAFVPYTVIVE
jgi:inhibitor of cysteine peptidase